MGRIGTGPLGNYTYGAGALAPGLPSPLHAALAIGWSPTSATWTAAYDAAGNMTCRAPTAATTCANGSTQTGAQLAYDTEGRLAQWQSQPTNPVTTAAYLYDGEGTRVAQQVVNNGTTTTTVYLGNLEEVATTGSSTTTTTYYYAQGQRIAVAVNGSISYVANDGLGSATASFDPNGNALASQLYAPYGGVRYSSGTLPGSYGFTGQRSDAGTSGLDYYNARYYDPAAGQFTSADSVLPGGGYDPWGLSRYAYVEGNPETKTDPTGHADFWGWLDSAASNVWSRATNPGNLLVDAGAFVMVGWPKAVQYFRQYRAIQKAAKGLTNAGRRILAETRFKDLPSKLLQLLRDPEYQSKAYQLGSRATRQADTALDEARLLGGDAAEMSRFAKAGGAILVGAGALVDGILTYSDYVSSHADDPNAQVKGIAYGALHAGLSAGLGMAGAALGMAIPIPGVDIVASIAFSAVGSSAGDWVADQVQSSIDSGAVAQTWNSATNAISSWIGGL